MAKSNKVNIRQVAASCGASPATVSRVLNGNPSVNPDLARRVLSAVEELGYQSSSDPHSRRNVVFIVPKLGTTYYSEVANGVFDAAWKAGYNVVTMLSNFDATQEQECLRRANNPDTAGILLTPVAGQDPLQFLPKPNRIPVIAVGPRHLSDGLIHIHTNNEEAAYITTRYLLLLGRRNIAFIAPFWMEHIHNYEEFIAEYNSPLRGCFSTYDRYTGYCYALEEAGLTPDPSLLAFGTFSHDSGYQCARNLLATAHTHIPDAIIAPNDRSGAGVLRLLTEQGFRVPDQISIACLNGELISEVVTPSLTTMDAGNYQLGLAAVEQLDHLIHSEPAHDVEVESKLIIKNSTQAISDFERG